MEIERSRSFDSQNCDELKSQLKHLEKLESGQCEQNKILSGKIDSLNSLNSQLSEDIIDLQSRSMRDNLLFFNVPEEQSFESRKSENCMVKILNFCENDLKIVNAKVEVKIDRAHRVGKFDQGKIRPVVVKFNFYGDTCKINDSARTQLRDSSVSVSDQFP